MHAPPDCPFHGPARTPQGLAGTCQICGRHGSGGYLDRLSIGGYGPALLLAPLAPTALVIFGQPESPNAQPINIFAGYLIGTVVAVLAMSVVPEPFWLATLCVGVVMLIMLALRVTHPPAAAIPLLTLTGRVDALTLFVVLFLACLLLVAMGTILHRLPPQRRRYPLPLAEEVEKE